jgi:hypothetical protein
MILSARSEDQRRVTVGEEDFGDIALRRVAGVEFSSPQ